MRNILEFGSHTNREFGVVVIKPPTIPTPQERGEAIEIPGRNGNVWKGEGAFRVVNIPVSLWIPPTASLIQVRGWLSGSGSLAFDDSGISWDARIVGDVLFSPCVFNDGWTTTVTFECQPFRRIAAGDIVIPSNPYIINNPYTAYAEPILRVQCTGDFSITIGGVSCVVEGLTGEVVLNSELQECYQGNTLHNDKMRGAFGILATGDTVIAYSGSVTSISIAPNWRTL